MPRPHAFVGGLLEVGAGDAAAAAAAGGPTVRLDSGRTARLDPADPRSTVWRSALESLRTAGLPVYLEIDPDSDAITEVLVPLQVTVESVGPDEGDAVEVELRISHARHYVRRDNPDYAELRGLLEQARSDRTPVLVTETSDGREIIDVRPLPKGLAAPAQLLPAPDLGTPAEAAVSPAQADQMFALVNGRTCCSAGPSAPCIPFTFPDDGCWGRAHEMCRLMIGAGVQPEKIWIYGQLRVRTANHPLCEVGWGWHVAPVLRVDSGSGPQVQVLDPALFPGPVPQATWTAASSDPSATTALSPADVFYRDFGGGVSYDPTYAQTAQVLTTYRTQLQLRSASPDGPPPYVQCLPRPPGVQWFGTLEPNTSRRWFTFGWPAGWHVVWTVMPLTICAGAPQLTWSVAVERADSGAATYWITVRNLTPRTVRFEGRYDVLSR